MSNPTPEQYRTDEQPQYGMPYPQAYPELPRPMSGIAIAALCTFWVPVVGLVLSIVGMVQTGAGKYRGQGLAIAALVLSIVMSLAYGAVGAMIGLKPSALDPGCAKGQAAIRDAAKKLDADGADPNAVMTDLQSTITQLDAAIASSHRADVKSAMQTIRGDYADLLQGVNAGNIDPNMRSKMFADGRQVGHLCTLGSK